MAVRKLSISLDEYAYDLLVAIAGELDRSLSWTVGLTIEKWAARSLPDNVRLPIEKKHGIKDESPKR